MALTPAQLASVTDEHVLSTPWPESTAIRATTPRSDQLDGSPDACRCSPDAPFGCEVAPARHRHDVAHRSTTAQRRFTADQRLAVDQDFRADLHGICGASAGCRATADTCYLAVRAFGGSRTTAAGVDAAGVSVAA